MKIGKLEIKWASLRIDTQDKAVTPVFLASFVGGKLTLSVGWWHYKLGLELGYDS